MDFRIPCPVCGVPVDNAILHEDYHKAMPLPDEPEWAARMAVLAQHAEARRRFLESRQ